MAKACCIKSISIVWSLLKINSVSVLSVHICVSWLSAFLGRPIDQFLLVVCVRKTQSSGVLTAFGARVSVINGLVGIDFSLENAAGCFSSMELPPAPRGNAELRCHRKTYHQRSESSL